MADARSKEIKKPADEKNADRPSYSATAPLRSDANASVEHNHAVNEQKTMPAKYPVAFRTLRAELSSPGDADIKSESHDVITDDYIARLTRVASGFVVTIINKKTAARVQIIPRFAFSLKSNIVTLPGNRFAVCFSDHEYSLKFLIFDLAKADYRTVGDYSLLGDGLQNTCLRFWTDGTDEFLVFSFIRKHRPRTGLRSVPFLYTRVTDNLALINIATDQQRQAMFSSSSLTFAHCLGVHLVSKDQLLIQNAKGDLELQNYTCSSTYTEFKSNQTLVKKFSALGESKFVTDCNGKPVLAVTRASNGQVQLWQFSETQPVNLTLNAAFGRLAHNIEAAINTMAYAADINCLFFVALVKNEIRLMHFDCTLNQMHSGFLINPSLRQLTAAPDGTLTLLFADGSIDIIEEYAKTFGADLQQFCRQRWSLLFQHFLPAPDQFSSALCGVVLDYLVPTLPPVRRQSINLPHYFPAELVSDLVDYDQRLLTEMQTRYLDSSRLFASKKSAQNERADFLKLVDILNNPANTSFAAICTAAEAAHPEIFKVQRMAQLRKRLLALDATQFWQDKSKNLLECAKELFVSSPEELEAAPVRKVGLT